MFKIMFSVLLLCVFTLASIAPALAAVEDDLSKLIAAKEGRIKKKSAKLDERKTALEDLNQGIETAKRNRVYYRVGGAVGTGLGVIITYKSYRLMKTFSYMFPSILAFITPAMQLIGLGGMAAGGALAVGGTVLVIVPPSKVDELQTEIGKAQAALTEMQTDLEIELFELEQLKKQL